MHHLYPILADHIDNGKLWAVVQILRDGGVLQFERLNIPEGQYSAGRIEGTDVVTIKHTQSGSEAMGMHSGTV